jgi:hypothetical protein
MLHRTARKLKSIKDNTGTSERLQTKNSSVRNAKHSNYIIHDILQKKHEISDMYPFYFVNYF